MSHADVNARKKLRSTPCLFNKHQQTSAKLYPKPFSLQDKRGFSRIVYQVRKEFAFREYTEIDRRYSVVRVHPDRRRVYDNGSISVL